ncbi:ParA [Mycobacterium phage 40AC]|uniref:ParA n=1 Tax=Mycobacterium phage 40AC TaxID=1458717 RepID=W8ECJ6_9CAUD|nr:ParA-like partition protein [Mycobacterium phage 40AC]AHJ86402.1 ParA [Mycobacterium phage 40AC]
MTVISIVHTKGGVGKTTTAMYLAVAAAKRGIDVCVLDADPQRSALDWKEDTDGGLPFPVLEASKNLDIPDHDLVLIDTPPGTAGVIQKAVDIADLVIIPCGPSPVDVRRVWPTLQIATTSKKHSAVLLTQVDLRTRLGEEVRSALTEAGQDVIHTPIIRRERVRRDYGTVPSNLNGYDDVLAELVNV